MQSIFVFLKTTNILNISFILSNFYLHLQPQVKREFKNNERRYFNVMIIINIKDGESLDKALKRFKKKFEKTGVLRELRSRQAYEKKSVARRTEIKHAVYIQNMNQEGTL